MGARPRPRRRHVSEPVESAIAERGATT